MKVLSAGCGVAILATGGFEQSELLHPQAAIEEAGADTDIVSLKTARFAVGKIKNWGQEVEVNETLDSFDPEEYDDLLLPGGAMNPDLLRMEPKAVAFVRAHFYANKPVAAICHGPWKIVEAGASKGRQMTSWPSVKSEIVNSGGSWLDQEVVVDKNLITSRKPDDLPAINRAIVKLLSNARPTVRV